jgi:hypothetical protein
MPMEKIRKFSLNGRKLNENYPIPRIFFQKKKSMRIIKKYIGKFGLSLKQRNKKRRELDSLDTLGAQ